MSPTLPRPARIADRAIAAATAAAFAAGLAASPPARAGAACSARSGPTATPVIELYTSEGCSSCPPADRWLSARVPGDAPSISPAGTLPAGTSPVGTSPAGTAAATSNPTSAAAPAAATSDPPPVALAFHVDYWDSLGWKDRFASPAYTQRQAQQRAVNGARFSYTPQVAVDGVDRPDWPSLARSPLARRAASTVELRLEPDGDAVRATVRTLPGAPPRLAAYWALTEDGHATPVRAGENQGATLHHDHVVRDYRPVVAWTVEPGRATTLQYRPAAAPDPAHPRRVNLVVIDADNGRPVQALRLGC